MDELRGGLGLLLELLHELRIGTILLEHDLYGHGAVEHLVPAHVDSAHAASPELALEKEVPVLPESSRGGNQLFAHLMILHPLNGQKTNDASPRRFARGTGPQYRLSKELLKLSPHAKYSSPPIVTVSG